MASMHASEEAPQGEQGGFLLKGDALFLSYEGCSMSKEAVYDALRSMLKLKTFTICEERTREQIPYIHAYVTLTEPVHWTSDRCCDLLDGEGVTWVGHYRSVEDPRRVYVFCTRGAQFLTNQEQTAPRRMRMARHKQARGRVHATKALVTLPYPTHTDNESYDADWDKTRASAWWHGVAVRNKCKHALSQFDAPLLVSSPEDLKRISQANDGVVFVNLGSSRWTRAKKIALLDIARDCRLYTAYGQVVLRRGVPRIFCAKKAFELKKAEPRVLEQLVHNLDFNQWGARD